MIRGEGIPEEALNVPFHPSNDARQKAKRRWDALTKPRDSLGRIEEIGIWLAGVLGEIPSHIERKSIVVFAADHGIVEEGVSAYPAEVTGQMVSNFARGGAAINVLCRLVGADLLVVDMGVAGPYEAPGVIRRSLGSGTRNFLRGPAMTRETAVAGVRVGLEIAAAKAREGCQVLGLGDMGIGNTTASSAVVASLTGLNPEHVTGRGTGLDDAGWARKVEVIRRALEVNRPNPKDGLDVLAKVGGFEIAGLTGAILGAARARIPVLLDGFIVGAAALVAAALKPDVCDCLVASHRSSEPGHAVILDRLGLEPLFDLRMRLGEGTGAALAMLFLDASAALFNEMATFEDAGVSRSFSKKA